MFFSFDEYILYYILHKFLSFKLSSLHSSLHPLCVLQITYQIPPSIFTLCKTIPYLLLAFLLCGSLSFTSAFIFTWFLFPPWTVSKPDYPACLPCLHRTPEEPSTPLGLFSTTTLNQQELYMVVPGLWINWQKLKSQTPNWSKQSWPTVQSWTLLMRSPA